ncbi:hydantoinase/oxoprolinase family protein [Bradyrhizobium manausense]|uniref:hydantoinase/oxoprolinase family protein n=1 Tax=Bradyrhizobium manausense TaxID=989370 RepID=UPI001BAA4224|nr:hydantoinase/oxoprolinase family protein [Bradyrhizobium manausense]MBR0828638.1 hydantoinase/oxoprolinase family protein [Bradyrhizobium manausense]
MTLLSQPGLGIDIGGTFTDLVLHDPDGRRSGSLKVLTTHDDPVRGILDGIERLLAEHDVLPSSIGQVVHATTLFTNALIERKGAKTAFITTKGFSDVLQIGRERRYELYDLELVPPDALVPAELCVEVPERVKVDGTVLVPLDLAALDEQLANLVAQGVQSVGVLFLHSDLYPAHEAAAVQRIRKRYPGLSVCASHTIVREVREFDRGCTVTANAYVAPLAERYLSRLAASLRDRDIEAPLLMMLSNGGLTHVREAQRVPVQLLESGPAAGAIAAAFMAGNDEEDFLAFDLGGTTAKLCVIEEGEPDVVFGFEAVRQARFIEGSGLPIRISTVDLIEIGAGGGSIARRDTIGLLKVGPDSAGSEPGPACYGRGGTQPTVTDANLLLGYLDPTKFAGGRLQLDVDQARNALEGLATSLGIDVEKVAWGIHDVVTETMAAAARVHLAERGRDASRFTLVCTGGGGPVHGNLLARKLNIRRIIVPREAGVASALGMLVAPPRVDRVATLGKSLDAITADDLENAFISLEEDASGVLSEGGWADDVTNSERLVDARCKGQGAYMPVRLPAQPWPRSDVELRALVLQAFTATYAERYGRVPPNTPVELVHVRVVLSGERRARDLATLRRAQLRVGAQTRSVQFGDRWMSAEVYWRPALSAGFRSTGPALVEEAGSTLVVGPGDSFTVLPNGNILMEIAS